MKLNNLEQAIRGLANDIVDQAKKNLVDEYKSNGQLYATLRSEIEQKTNEFIVKFYMQDYGIFVDKGVKGKTSTYPKTRAALSQFQYGSGNYPKGGLTEGVLKWVKRKRFQWRTEDGKFMSYDAMSLLIARSIYNKGIEATEFFSKPFDRVLKEVPIELIEAFTLDIEYALINFKKQ